MRLAAPLLLGLALLARMRQPRHGAAREIERLQSRIREQAREVAALRRRLEAEQQQAEVLVQDAHHRIGNALTTVSSLMSLQLMRSSSVEARDALHAARSRVHAIASVHRRLRLQEGGPAVAADQVITAVLDELSLTSDRSISLVTGIVEPIGLGVRDATSMGLLISELVTNALEHAFVGRGEGSVTVSLARDGASIAVLRVVDNGVGLRQVWGSADGGLGTVIVAQLATQFGGAPLYDIGSDGGLSVSISLPNLSRLSS